MKQLIHAFHLPLALLALAAPMATLADDPYIQSNGKQFIQLDYYQNCNTRVELDAALVQPVDTTKDQYLFGSHGQNTPGIFGFAMYVKKTTANTSNWIGWCCQTNNSNYTESKTTIIDDSRHTFILDAYGKEVAVLASDGSTMYSATMNTKIGNGRSPYAFTLGCARSKDGTYSYLFQLKIYGLKIYESGTLIRDYSPAIKGGVPGLHDPITGDFCGAIPANGISSVAQFTAVGSVPVIEDDPYIESDGTAQTGINSRYKWNALSRVEVDYAYTATTPVQMRVFGADWEAPRASLYLQGTGRVAFGFDSADHTAFTACTTSNLVDTVRHTAIADQKLGKAWISTCGVTNGLVVAIPSTPTAEGAVPIALFGSMDTGGSTGLKFHGADNSSKARIYRVRFWTDDVLIHDYTPLVKGGIPGFIDAVDGAFITSENIATLTAGSATPRVADDPWVSTPGNNYLNAYGNDSRFDTGYIPTYKTRCELDYALAENYPDMAANAYTNTAGGSANWDWYGFAAYGSDSSRDRFSFYYNKGGIGCCGAGVAWKSFSGFSRQKTAKDVRRTMIADNTTGFFAIQTSGYTNSIVQQSPCASTVVYTSTIKLASLDNGTQSFCSLKIYSFKIFEDGTLVRDFRPYVTNSVPGLRCALTGTLLSNGGAKAPVECGGSIPMDGSASHDAWISSSTTDTFSIDTGYNVGPNTRMDADFSFLARTREVYPVEWTGNYPQQFPFEASGNLVSRIYINGSAGTGNLAWSNSKSGNWTGTTVTMKPGDRYSMTVQADGGNSTALLVVGGVTKYDNSASPIAFDTSSSSSRTIKLFSNATATGNWAMMKLYSFRIYEKENGAWSLKREFLPYTDGTRVGLYDTVDGGVYWNTISGSPDFTMGGMGVDGAERWVKALPAMASVSKNHTTVTLTAAAAGAQRYKWALNGEEIADAAGESITAAWRKGNYDEPDVYTCTAVYNVFGVETEGTPAVCEVTRLPDAFMLIVR